jgi:hypothetical protein
VLTQLRSTHLTTSGATTITLTSGLRWRSGRNGDGSGVGQAGGVSGPNSGHQFAQVGPCRVVKAGFADVAATNEAWALPSVLWTIAIYRFGRDAGEQIRCDVSLASVRQ